MLSNLSALFRPLCRNPRPNTHDHLFEHREAQWRPFSINPFVLNESSVSEEVQTSALPSLPLQRTHSDDEKIGLESKETEPETLKYRQDHHDIPWGEQAPEWLSLFYDLAWTATFSSITSSYSFNAKWDALTYTALFALTWWIWASQVFYSIDFYTDDWFHLIGLALQLVVFGGLSAVTRDLDISTYITHSPGSSKWETDTMETMTPKIFMAQKLAQPFFEQIALIVALSRLLLLLQYLVVISWAVKTSGRKRLPRRLLIVPISLGISTAFFFAAYAVTKHFGDQRLWAIGKFVLWAAGVIVEIIAHVWRLQHKIEGTIRLKSHGSIVARFTTITTIIMGEGINAIAGALYSIEKAPGFAYSLVYSIMSCAAIIFGLMYLYYQGCAPMKPVRRRAAWAMAHWFWLLSVILLLSAVKNQLLLINFINSSGHITAATSESMTSNSTEAEFNKTLSDILLQSGLTLDDQYRKWDELRWQNMSDSNVTKLSDAAEGEIFQVWYFRMQMESVLNIYMNFMENHTISDEVQSMITQYQYHYDYAYQDVADPEEAKIWLQVVWKLIEPGVTNTRYIMVLCGATFWALATLNIIHSWPQDRFQWGSILCRYAMGGSMMMLALLNLGKYQTYFTPLGVPDSQRAGVINWMDYEWVLPTLAIAYTLQFVLDTLLLGVAVRFSRSLRRKSSARLACLSDKTV